MVLGSNVSQPTFDLASVTLITTTMMIHFTVISCGGSLPSPCHALLQVMARPQELPYNKSDVLRAFKMFQKPGDPTGQIQPEVLEQALVGHTLAYCTKQSTALAWVVLVVP